MDTKEGRCFPILNLPRELRDQIYFAVLSPARENVQILWSSQYGRARSLSITPAILQTNKQIYSEAIHYLYCKSTDVWQIDLYGRNLEIYGVSGRDYTKRPGYSGPELFRPNPRKPEIKAKLDEWDQQLRQVSLESEAEVKGSPLEFGMLTGKAIFCLRSLEIVFSTWHLWQRCHKYDNGIPSFTGKALVYILGVLESRKECKPRLQTLTIIMKSNEHHYIPSSALKDEVPWNKKIVQLLRAIQRKSTQVRVIMDEQVHKYPLKKITGKERDPETAEANISGKLLFGDTCEKKNCEYCDWDE